MRTFIALQRASLGIVVLIAAGCTPNPPANRWNGPSQTLKPEPWQFDAEFSTWKVRQASADTGRVYSAPNDPGDPLRGPALLSEFADDVPANFPLKAMAAEDYQRRPGGRVGTAWVDEPNTFIFDGYYDAAPAVPFHAVCRLERVTGTRKVLILTYTRRADEFSADEVTLRVAQLRAAKVRP